MNFIKVFFLCFFTILIPISLYYAILFFIFGKCDPKFGCIGTFMLSLMINAIGSLISAISISFAYFIINKNYNLTKNNIKSLIIISLLISFICYFIVYFIELSKSLTLFIILWILFSFLSSFIMLKFYK
ncbi:putative membrane protein [Aliarcobacter lanthieri]|nr:putative membrane protein [Aliarcobacter lanthieri]